MPASYHSWYFSVMSDERSSGHDKSVMALQRWWRILIGACFKGPSAGFQKRTILAIAIAVSGTNGTPANAALDDAVNLEVGGTAVHDSNVFRTPDFVKPRPDTIYSGIVGLHVDKPYAQQRFQFDIMETSYRYEKLSNLDYDALNYRAAWLWHFGPRVSGTLEANESKSQIPFQNTNATTRNVRTTKNYIFGTDGEIAAPWHLLFGIAQSDQASEEVTQGAPDLHSTRAEGGVRYITLSGNTVSFVERLIRGQYTNVAVVPNNPINDNFRGYESDLQAHWVLNSKSALIGRLAWIDRHGDNFSQFDFSGLVGNVGYTWTPTAKFRVETGAEQNIVAWQDATATHRVDDMLFIASVWQASPKIALRMRLEHVQSDFRGGALRNGEARRDTADNALLGVEWTPARAFTAGASLANQKRSSNDINSEYRATVATLTASLKF